MALSKTTTMAFEGRLLYDVYGATATTLMENASDITITSTKTYGDTTPKGDGTAAPVESSRITKHTISMSWSMLNKTDDTSLTALLTAEAAGTPVALHGEASATGKGPDFDWLLEVTNGQPKNGEQTYSFTARPTDEGGRVPVIANLYV